ncbi:MAG: hypothetical protein ACI9IV_000494, partial [Paracoccaceae bacterium]
TAPQIGRPRDRLPEFGHTALERGNCGRAGGVTKWIGVGHRGNFAAEGSVQGTTQREPAARGSLTFLRKVPVVAGGWHRPCTQPDTQRDLFCVQPDGNEGRSPPAQAVKPVPDLPETRQKEAPECRKSPRAVFLVYKNI